MIEIQEAKDTLQILDLHRRMGLDYELNMDRRDFVIRNGVFDSRQLVAAVLGRLTTEAYLLLDKQWGTPVDRWDAIQRLARVSAMEAKDVWGIEDTHVWLPPKAGCFKRRLERMGFIPVRWDCMTARF